MPSPADLHVAPPLGPRLLLEFAAAVTANALCAHHVVVEVGFFPGETHEVAAARSLVQACDQLVQLSTITVAMSSPACSRGQPMAV